MTDLLSALHWKVSLSRAFYLMATIATVTILALVFGAIAVAFTPVSAVVLQSSLWGLWLIWLGLVFPRSRQRDQQEPCIYPYRRAFQREILFGVAIAFSQILRPLVSGFLAANQNMSVPPLATIGLPLAIAGASILVAGISALGVARTLFVYEYVPTDKPVTAIGIFRVLRHPLFLGGAMISLGLGICTGTQSGIELGLVNACIVPIYVHLEDRRCSTALGQEYVDYRTTVGGVIPRRRSRIARSAFARHDSERMHPASPLECVTTS